MECSICLGNITETDKIKKLSCNHKFHLQCFLDLVYRDNNIYINCPLCRETNISIEKPTNDHIENIKLLCKEKRCSHITKDGKVCKRKCKLLNNGYCYQHQKMNMSDDQYKLMEKYIYLVLCQQGRLVTKLRMIDLGKKLIIKFGLGSENLDQILEKFYRYFSLYDLNSIDSWNNFYNFYEIEKPCNQWIKYCSDKHCII